MRGQDWLQVAPCVCVFSNSRLRRPPAFAMQVMNMYQAGHLRHILRPCVGPNGPVDVRALWYYFLGVAGERHVKHTIFLSLGYVSVYRVSA